MEERRPRGRLAWVVVLCAFAFVPTAPADAAGRLGLRVNEGGSSIAATYAPRQQAVKESIKLNGRHVEKAFEGAPPAGRQVLLGLDEGVRFGRNTLRVRAVYHDGKVVEKVRRFHVDSRRPLAGISGERRVHEGVPMTLRARTAPRGTSRSERLAFRSDQGQVRSTWKILDRPEGSDANLRDRHAAQPRFRPDAPGIYRVGLSASRGGTTRSVSVPLIVLSAEVTKAGVFVDTEPIDISSEGNPTALRIFTGPAENSYPIGSGNGQSGPIVTLIFDRCTLTPIGDPLYTNAGLLGAELIYDAFTKAQSELANSSCSTLVVTAGADYGDMSFLGPALDRWSGQATENFGNPSLTAPFWAVYIPPPLGSPDTAKGNGWSNYPYFDGTSAAGRLAGELVPDQNDNYVLRRSTAPAFGQQNTMLQFGMDSSGITLPEQGGPPGTFQAGEPGCPQNGKGGFQLLAVGASGQDVLDNIDIGTAQVNGQTVGSGDTFWVNGCDGNQADGEAWAEALKQVMSGIDTGFNYFPMMIFIQGVGNALPPADQMTADQTQALRDVAAMIGEMGGSPGAFLNNPAATSGPGYAFAGQTWPLPGGARVSTEVTSSTPGGPPAQLDGFIQPDRIGRLAPATGTPAGDGLGPALETYRAMESASAIVNPGNGYEPTPFPGAGDEEWENAMYYLAKNVFGIVYDPTDACYVPKMDSNGIVYDIRATYCGGGGGKGTGCTTPYLGYYGLIAPGEPGAKYVPGNGFSSETWAEVLPQLQAEFTMLDSLNCTSSSLQAPFGAAVGKGDLPVSEMVTTVNDYIKTQMPKPNETAQIVGDAFEVVASLANVIAVGFSAQDAWTAMNAAWGVQGVIDLGESLASFPVTGGPVLGPLPVGTTAIGYASVLDHGLSETSAALVTPRNQIASDWGRLQAFDEAHLDLQLGDVTAAETALSYATYDRVWRQLLPSVFPPTHLNVNKGNPPPVNAKTWTCLVTGGQFPDEPTQPFAGFPANSYTLYPEGATQANPTGLESYALAATQFGDGDVYSPVPAPNSSVLKQLFTVPPDLNEAAAEPVVPPGSPNAVATPLGINKEQFYANVIGSAQAANPSQINQLGQGTEVCPS